MRTTSFAEQVFWAGALGYAAEDSFRRVGPYAGDTGLVLAGIIGLVGGIAIAGRWASRHENDLHALAQRQLRRPWVARLRARFATQLFLAHRRRPRGALGLSLTLALWATVAAGWVFGAVLEDAPTGTGILALDAVTVTYLADHRVPWLTSLMVGITAFGGTALALPIALLAGADVAARLRRWQPLALVLVATLGANVLSRTVKLAVHRGRPPLELAVVDPSGYAFPSGHAVIAAVTYGVVAYLISQGLPGRRARVAVWAGAAIVVVLVGMSRVYLGAHWPSDVVGGWALGAIWLGLVLASTALTLTGSPRHPTGPSRATRSELDRS